jgi:SNF2 family DNA or RNA helicase
MGVVVQYLLQAATNPALLSPAIANTAPGKAKFPPSPVSPDSSLAEKIANYGTYEMPRKFEKLAAMVKANAEKNLKTLVWANFVPNLLELHKRILAPYEPALIYGGVRSGGLDEEYLTREQELRRFRKDPGCLVLLANPAAMSEGVSLHEECHDAIYVDRTFNAGQYLQSLDRIHRLGLPPGTETRITFLVSTGTVDEIVAARVRTKAERLSRMLSDPNLVTMALPDDDAGDELVDLDAEDLAALFDHLSSDGA